MGPWPAIVTDPDALWPTEDYPDPVRDDHQQVVPAELARELYEASRDAMNMSSDPVEGARCIRRVKDALARYEDEVGAE